MKKRLGYLASTFAAVALAVFALAACSSSDSPTLPESSELTAADSTEPTSAGSSETTAPESSESTEPTSAESTTPESAETTTPGTSETTTPESSESTTPESTESSTPESAETVTTSSTSDLTPLQQYEQAQAFIDDGWRDECLKLANEYRATEGVAPLTLADDDKQLCAITQAAADMADNAPHGHFRDCDEWAQNSGPNFSTSWKSNATAAAQYYIKMMWEDEKELVTSGQRDPNKDEDYSYIGHYLNMRKASYTKLACGIAISADGTKGWFNMNFY